MQLSAAVVMRAVGHRERAAQMVCRRTSPVGSTVRRAPIRRQSSHSGIAIGCGRNACGSLPSTLVTPSSNQATSLESQPIQEIQFLSGQTLRNPKTMASIEDRP